MTQSSNHSHPSGSRPRRNGLVGLGSVLLLSLLANGFSALVGELIYFL